MNTVNLRLNGTGECACPATGYFDIFAAGNVSTYDCVPCPAPCQTCTSATNCGTCYSNTNNVRLNGTGVCACPATGYFDIFAAGNVNTYDCVACPAPCQICISSISCVTCYSNTTNVRLNGTGACACPSTGYYDILVAGNVSTYDCQPCPAPCRTCNSSTNCTSCYTNTNNVRLNGTGVCACPPIGYFDIFVIGDVSTYDCQPCPAKCATCTSTTNCSSCYTNSTNVRLNTTSLCTCPKTGYFDIFAAGNVSTYDCVPCPASCQTCTSATNCSICYTNSINLRLNGTGVCACPATGYFDTFVAGNVSTYDCQLCPAKCITCTSNSSCGTCYTTVSSVRLNGTGVCECPATGYFDIFVVENASTYDCQSCPAKCPTCTSSINCSTCFLNTTDVRLNWTGLCACPTIGYFDIFVAGNVSTYDCQPCPAPCRTCTSATSCSTCNFNTTNVRINGSNLCACPSTGYFDIFVAGNVSTYDCQPCSANCLNCTDAISCITCANGL